MVSPGARFTGEETPMEPLETDGATEAHEAPPRCNAAEILSDVNDEQGPCEGPQDAVLLLSSVDIPTERVRQLLGTRGCVHHGAYLYARLAYARVYPNGDEHGGAAIEVYRRAMRMADEQAAAHVADAWGYMAGGMAA